MLQQSYRSSREFNHHFQKGLLQPLQHWSFCFSVCFRGRSPSSALASNPWDGGKGIVLTLGILHFQDNDLCQRRGQLKSHLVLLKIEDFQLELGMNTTRSIGTINTCCPCRNPSMRTKITSNLSEFQINLKMSRNIQPASPIFCPLQPLYMSTSTQ